jgi:hypothetical protein
MNWDAIGVATSVACAIHCALLPLILTSLPLFGVNIIHNSLFEYGMIALAFGVGVYSLFHGYRRHHHQFLPVIIFFTGFVFLVLKQLLLSYEIMFLIPAVSCIVTAHIVNFQFCRKANHCHTDDCDHDEI